MHTFLINFDAAGQGGEAGGGAAQGTLLHQGQGEQGQGGQAAALPPSDFREFLDPQGNFTKQGWADPEFANLEKRFSNVKTLAKSYAHLERLNSSQNKVAIPGENATEEELNAFYSKLGRPESADKYEMTVPDNLKEVLANDEAFKQFKGEAFKLGLNVKQVQALGNWYFGTQAKAIEAVQAQHQAVISEATSALKKEWGASFDVKLEGARRAALVVGGEELLANPKLANDPGFIRAMAKVSEMISEKGLPGQAAPNGKSPAEEINEIMANKQDPYWNQRDPRHATRVEYVNSLYRQKVATSG